MVSLLFQLPQGSLKRRPARSRARRKMSAATATGNKKGVTTVESDKTPSTCYGVSIETSPEPGHLSPPSERTKKGVFRHGQRSLAVAL